MRFYLGLFLSNSCDLLKSSDLIRELFCQNSQNLTHFNIVNKGLFYLLCFGSSCVVYEKILSL